MADYYQRKQLMIEWLENQLRGIAQSDDPEIEESRLIEEGSRKYMVGELTIKKRLILMAENGRLKRQGGFVIPKKASFKK